MNSPYAHVKSAVHWANDLTRDILNNRHYPLSALTGELGELADSVKNLDYENFKEELGDSAFLAQVIASQRSGINLPVIGVDSTINKFFDRLNTWKKIFNDRGVEFKQDYLKGGSNYSKLSKIQKAFAAANTPITLDDAKAIAQKYNIKIENENIDSVKVSGVVTDHIGAILGSGLGLAAGTAVPIIAGMQTGQLVYPTLLMPFIGSGLGGAVGQQFDEFRLKKKIRGKTIHDYRFSDKELKDLGFSKQQIDEILKHPTHTKKSFLKYALEVNDKENILFRPVSGILGKVLSDPLYTANIGIPSETASLENKTIKNYIESLKDHPGLKDVTVNLGSTRLLDKLYGIWNNSNNPIEDKLYHSITLPNATFWEALNRADHFDPISNTVTVYHDSPGVLAHELGHALDYNTAKDKELWRRMYFAKGPIPQEYLASNLAVNKLTEDFFKDKGNLKSKEKLQSLMSEAQQLENALNSYIDVYGKDGLENSVNNKDRKAKSSLEFFLSHPKYGKRIKALMQRHKLLPK
jgi:NTP pyrophosphatase (non-canonical NTP hydrolase)